MEAESATWSLRPYHNGGYPSPRREDIIVVKGRKVAPGTIARGEYIADSDFGRRIRMTTSDGVTHWTPVDNVELLDVLPWAPCDHDDCKLSTKMSLACAGYEEVSS
jgi:hypothetical protein